MSSERWRNWAGSVACTPARRAEPRSVEEVVATVRAAAAHGPLRVVGSGHSFSDVVATSGTLLSLRHLSGVFSVDRALAQATVWAGTTLRALGPALLAEGLALENMGDIDAQSLAGALATATHGTGAGLANMSSQVRAMTLVDAGGRIVECGPETPDLLRAARVSLGALGVVVKVTLQLVPAYRLREVRVRESFDACAERWDERAARHRHVEFFCFPYSDTVVTKTLDVTEEAPRGNGWGRTASDLLVENGAFSLVSQACRAFPRLCAPVSRVCAGLAGESGRVDQSHRVFASPRWVRFQEMEYALPRASGLQALREVRAMVERRQVRVHFPFEIRLGRGDDADLSPAPGRDVAYVAVHMYRGMPFELFFREAEAILRDHGGRPHWGKWHSQDAGALRAAYPRWDAFQQVRRQLDPHGLFSSPAIDRVLGPVS